MTGIKNIIFDLGGVVLDIDFKLTEKAFAQLGMEDFSSYITQHHITPLFEDYETGKIDDAAFIKGVQDLSGLPLTEQQIIRAWNALLLEFSPARIEWLKALKHKYRLFLLSNTNAIHLREFQERLKKLSGGYLEDIFEKTYYSHAVRMRKPHAEIYRLVIEENGLNPSETLFIDDTASNFSGAEEVGLKVLHLKPPMTILDLPVGA
ncbi:MAG TPA: HAD family phosphatase [Chitinophagaceae bacterium]|nr:HAD family phosphatase [Chitinophagaceae bacterium]